MCETPFSRLEPRPLPLHSTNTYTCERTIAPRVCEWCNHESFKRQQMFWDNNKRNIFHNKYVVINCYDRVKN